MSDAWNQLRRTDDGNGDLHNRRNNGMDVLSQRVQFSPADAKRHLVIAATFCVGWFLFAGTTGIATGQESAVDTVESAESEPYIVFVAESSAHARCGPGKEHYRTESLRRGQELEVYVETATGWLGIRPPKESFCWMPSDAVEVASDEQTALILEDETVAWIGTHLGQARRYRWQVQLSAGEQVSIIGKNQRESSEGTKTWYRIVPPSGEFRWVHRDQVVESAEQLAEKLADSLVPSRKRSSDSAPEVASGNLPDNESKEIEGNPTLSPLHDSDPSDRIAQTSRLESSTDSPSTDPPSSVGSSRRGTQTDALHQTSEVPELRPAPGEAGAMSGDPPQVADKAIQFHRDANVNDFEDRGAVIGSGLRRDWQEDGGSDRSELAHEAGTQSVLDREGMGNVAAGGGVIAASAIAEPIRRMTDVVANFISPPRLVEIDPASHNALALRSSADRRWTVGSGRTYGTGNPITRVGSDISSRPTSLGSPSTLTGSNYGQTASTGSMVMQTSAIGAQAALASPVPSRIISIAQITRVEDAMAGADLAVVSQVLSKLMAEGASALELDPLIRRTEALLQSGEVNETRRTREVLELAQNYRNIAARRDGATTVESTANSNLSLPELRQPAGLDASSVPQGVATPFVPASLNELASAPTTITKPLGPVAGTATGYLVQVYSSRANSPPFALTDDAGLTVAYVTPYPGVNLRSHLNSKIAVRGNEKLLDGMSTPHILVDQAIRR